MLVLVLIKALLYTAVLSLFSTILDFPIAKKIGAIDVPADSRRMHRIPVPRIGGISIFFAFITVSLTMGRDIAQEFVYLSFGAVIIAVTGIIDDSYGLSPYFKLLCQAVSATIFLWYINPIYDLNVINNVIFLIFILTFINAHNFIDGLDGLCSGIAIIESLSIGILFFLIGRTDLSLISFVLCGAYIGFYPYNFKNAKIFMGDTGSTFIGYSIGALAILLFLNSYSLKAILSVFLILFVPLFDIMLAVTRRISSGKNPFSPDRSHIHHVLCDLGLKHKSSSLFLQAASLLFSFIGIVLFVILK